MIDFETLMFCIAFAPIILIVIFVEVILRIIFRKGKDESRDKRSSEENVSREASPNGNVQSNT